MKQLVEVKGGKPFCDSQTVAEKFGHKHLYVIKAIERLIAAYDDIEGEKLLPLSFIEIERTYHGQSFKAYLIGRESFSLLAMRFSGKRALEWQAKFNAAFYAMEKQLLLEAGNKSNLLWKEQREQGKVARKSETDTIKDFVEYATKQGSTSAQFYYKHITVACYRCLNLIESQKPKLRDTLEVMQLNQLLLAEVVAERSIIRHMANGEHYKAVFALVKEDLERFAASLLLPGNKYLS